MELTNNNVAIVMVPLPAQGHLNQLLHLTRLLSTNSFPVHFIGSSIHNRQAKSRLHGYNLSTLPNIQFHDFELPKYITPPADTSNKGPVHLLPAFEAYLNLRQPLGVLIRELAERYRRVVVVHDSLMSFAAEEAASVENAEAYSFVSISVFAYGDMVDKENSSIPGVACDTIIADELRDFITRNSHGLKFCSGDIYNTCDAIEGRFLDLQKNKNVWAIGPFHPVEFDSNEGPRHYSLEWLDRQPPSSVIYVSFGTLASFSDNQIVELANGLEHSGQRFIWVLRDADRGDIYSGDVRKSQLPSGFEERIKGLGMVVRDWAPQLQILAHSSTGGFMSHCGWNSTIESLSMGVPVATWPMGGDQPRNAYLITEILKVGLTVREWSPHEELIPAADIEMSVKKLMLSDEGDKISKKAKELGVNIRHDVSESGSSTAQLKSLLAHISR
ncbi:cis-zeatin O-beta-D-glucosyltransferase [Ranunculus cassubicifolius]